jgi:hypothetical protein
MAETDATNADVDRAIRDCYQCYADACIEHDVDHAQRALEESVGRASMAISRRSHW